jgi:hypothetical protein
MGVVPELKCILNQNSKFSISNYSIITLMSKLTKFKCYFLKLVNSKSSIGHRINLNLFLSLNEFRLKNFYVQLLFSTLLNA